MADQDNRPTDPENLRQKAEAIAREPAARAPKDRAAFSTEETQKTLHELQVHQIELEMQNEELRTIHAQIEAERERYYDLYDLAPVGYCTLSEKGLILETNLTAATLLGTHRGELTKQPFSRFIFKEDQDIHSLHRKQLSEAGESQEYDLRLLRPDDAFFWAHLKTTAAQAEDGAPVSHVVLVDITERKRAENELSFKNVLMKTQMEASLDGILAVDENDKFIFFNQRFADIWEIPDSIMSSQSSEKAVQYVLPKLTNPEEFATRIRDLYKNKQEKSFEEIALIDGKTLERYSSPMFGSNGKYYGRIWFYRDITGRKQTEKALAQKSKFLEKTQALASLGSWEWDILHDTLYFSEQWKKIHGASDNDLDMSKLMEIAHPEDVPYIEKAFSDACELGKTYDIEHRIIRLDNKEIRDIKALGEVEFDQNTGCPVRMVGTSQDITERKQAETYREMRREILQILNEPGDPQEALPRVVDVLKTQAGVDAVGLRLQDGDDFPYFVQDGFPADFLQTENTLVERDKDGGLCRDKDGNVRLECTCGLVVSGQTEPSSQCFTKGGSSWTNDSFPYLDLPSDQDPRLHPRNNCIHQGYASVALIPLTYSRENCIRHNFSSMVQVPIRTSDRIVGLIQLNDKRKDRFTLETIEVLESIAAHIGMALMRKRAEAEQKKLQSQLNQAQKMEAIGTMAGGIAHDFNNLIAIVSSNIEAIQIKQQRKSPFEKNVENIKTASNRAKNLVSQILAFSRQEKTELKLIDLSATIDESLKLLRSTIPTTIEIMNVLANQPIFIDADSTLMQQILFNLCNNATYAMNGKGLLKIALNEVVFSSEDLPESSKLPAGTYAKLSISDTGPGIDKDTIIKIFDPFFTTKAVGAGTGMGLSVVHGIVEQHGGFITVDSSPGQGTTFDLFFPARVNLEEDRKTSNAEPLPTGTERILFVDDEECIAYTCNELLECQGYKVTSVTSGIAALDLFRANPDDFDLVFTDQTMPVMSGTELATELLRIRPDIPIILCSGYSAMVSEEDAKGIGIREFYMKPMDMKQLATVARKVLDESGEAT